MQITRREAVKGAIAVLGAGSVLTGHPVDAGAEVQAAGRARRRRARDRVAVIGAGAAGIATTYLLGDRYDVDLFEARSRIGGHCDTRVINYRGRRIAVDLGAQFFHPETHPLYVTLLAQLGLFDPAYPDAAETLQAPASLCIFPTAGGPPVFSSTNPFTTPHRAVQFLTYIRLAREAVLSDLPWETTVGAWIRGLTVSEAFKRDIVTPWITALIGCSRADAMRASARSILQTFALSFPADVSQPASTYNSRIGLQGNLRLMLDRSPTARVHRNAPVRALRRRREEWLLQTPGGVRGPYRHVVLNAPPHVGRGLLRPLAGFAHRAALLREYEYFDSRLVIHTGPAYVQPSRRNWAVYNAGVSGDQCEGSVWYGGLHPRLESGATVDVFKSWDDRRRTQPARVLLSRRYKHPKITPAAIEAARALGPLQGRDGLHFAGVYTTGFDSQESAIWSALGVARSLTADSPPLAALDALLSKRGLSGVTYEL